MLNPLRIPIVLIVVLASMVLYIHAYHRRVAEFGEVTAPDRDHLQLRQSADLTQSSGFQGATPPKGTIPSEVPERSVGTEASRVGTERHLPLPKQAVRDARSSGSPPTVARMGPIVPQSSIATPTDPSPVTTLPTAESPRRPSFPERPSQLDRRPPSPVVMHRIVDGDTLPLLAERYLGDRSRYMEILDQNRRVLTQPDLLPLGARLRIPAR